MEKLKHEIQRVKRYNLEYYHSHLTLVESYIEEKPDISIETCKALIEGISILALHLLNQEPINSHQNDSFFDLFKRALVELQKGRGFSDIDMVRRVGAVVQYVGEVRNSHCDIGHGRASLKDQINDADFAEFIIGITDNLCTYMLRRLDQLSEKELKYEDNPAFNEYLVQCKLLSFALLVIFVIVVFKTQGGRHGSTIQGDIIKRRTERFGSNFNQGEKSGPHRIICSGITVT